MSDETPQQSAGTVLAGEPDRAEPATWEERVAALWERAEELHEEEVLAAVEELAAERPAGDPLALFERAGAHDFAGRDAEAAPLYRAALDAGLAGELRAQALVQLAASLRAVGRPADALDVLGSEGPGPEVLDPGAADDAGDDGFAAASEGIAALCLADLGRDREGLVRALLALARHAGPYGPALEAYGAELRQAGAEEVDGP
ncbi:tetratricopeptide repeat protein [Kineococcus xinjiangensis]|uniref:tetratricopeptide repeat protein n=1 Tax=Kineococcus xinjiangensis TaxID=512762 RepID=UPI001B801BDA|nr:tetratricopeptide repeat protein [Kineococcus xinjiangensis]